MTTQKTLPLLLAAAVIAVLGFAFMPKSDAPEVSEIKAPASMPQEMVAADQPETPFATETVVTSEPAAGEEDATAIQEDTAPAAVDVEKAMMPRVLGDENAPVTIEEFASLTCSHCAHFHEQTFGELKKEYIDTGKVRFIFNDFPLNTPARDATIVARCLPHDRYFKFISFLFQTQDKWAYDSDYAKALKQNAKLLGGSESTLDACLNSDELKEALAKSMQDASEKYKIQSTPSFVLNGTEQLSGAQPFSVFKEKIDKLLEESNKAE
ncbi:MAG: DsbA family protein [Rhodospirillales bacterium]|nr:DsbA family protein [Rhodospirillales bacterium]